MLTSLPLTASKYNSMAIHRVQPWNHWRSGEFIFRQQTHSVVGTWNMASKNENGIRCQAQVRMTVPVYPSSTLSFGTLLSTNTAFLQQGSRSFQARIQINIWHSIEKCEPEIVQKSCWGRNGMPGIYFWLWRRNIKFSMNIWVPFMSMTPCHWHPFQWAWTQVITTSQQDQLDQGNVYFSLYPLNSVSYDGLKKS